MAISKQNYLVLHELYNCYPHSKQFILKSPGSGSSQPSINVNMRQGTIAIVITKSMTVAEIISGMKLIEPT